MAFYAAAAQVIPFLFVALIVEYRLLDSRVYSRGGNAFTQLLVVGALGLGEAAALRALYNNAGSPAARDVVAAGLATGGFWVWYTPVLSILRSGAERELRRRHKALPGQVIWLIALVIPPLYLALVIYALVHGV